MFVFTKVKTISSNNIEDLYYYAAHNNTKYYLIASCLLGKQTNSRTLQKIQQNLMKCVKVTNQSGTKLIKWDSSRSIKWIYFVKKKIIR